MLQLEPENTILRDTVARRLKSVAEGGKGETFDVRFGEFDGVYYHMVSFNKVPTELTLSLALPPGCTRDAETDAATTQAYNAIAPGVVAAKAPERGYSITLVASLDKVPGDKVDMFVSKLAAVRSIVQGIPLRRHLSLLSAEQSKRGPVEIIPYREGQSMYVKPLEDAVIIVFPMQFADENDATVATNFLQNFAETKRQANLSNAPACTYHLQAPLEVQEACKSKGLPVVQANGGFMSFSMFSRHVAGPRLETARGTATSA